MLNDKLKDALNYDSLVEAEKITGKSYKWDDGTSALGFILMHDNAKKKAKLLEENKDTDNFNQTTSEWINVIMSMGFEQVYSADIPETDDKHYIFWCDGVLLNFDTYNKKSINSANAYFNSNTYVSGCSGRTSKNGNFIGNVDAREGLRFHLDQMDILPIWEERPFIWLLNYMDTKVDGYDYKAINEERISKLPEHVRNAITPIKN